ncbi:MAG: DMT family transporter, partial [Candidatus Heimdallarchaeota archaeon]
AIILGSLANSIYNIGLVFKKKGACTLPDIEDQSVWQNIKNFTHCKSWVFGYVLTLIQWFPLMLAIKLGGLSLVAPTMAVGFIILILFSWLFLKEPIRVMEIIGIVIIIGAIVALYVGPQFDPANLNLDTMIDRFVLTKGYSFLITLGVIIALLLFATVGRKYSQAGGLMAMGAGLSYAFATIFAKGTIGSLDFGEPTFWQNSVMRWEWWIFLFVMLIGYTVAFTSQQMAFQKGKAIVVSPILDVMNLLAQVSAGVIVFAEWYNMWLNDLTPWQKVLKIASLALILVGVALLSSSKAKDEVVPPDDTDKKEDLDEEPAKDGIYFDADENLDKEDLPSIDHEPTIVPTQITETKHSPSHKK